MTEAPEADTPAATTAEVTESSAEAAASQADVTGEGVVTYSMVPEETSVTYEVSETFLREGNVLNVAVGQTQGVTGEIQLNFDQPQESTVGAMTVDISGFTSDSDRRDNAIRTRFLQTSQFPMVTFTPTTIDGLPETIEPGIEYPVVLQGDLTIRETTKPASFDASVQLQDEALTGQATTTILMSDFGFGPIDILDMLKTEDQVKVTVEFVAQQQ
jgi:polyisoprenoid-binding protein YceI